MRRTTNNRSTGLTAPRLRSYDGIFKEAFRYPPYQLDKLTSQKGFEVADDMLNTAACRAPFNLKRFSILSNGWEIVPAVKDPKGQRRSEAVQYSDFVTWALTSIVSPAGIVQDFRSVLFEMLRACWDGFRLAEIGYRYLEEGPYAGKLGYDGFYAKHAKQIGFDIDRDTSQIVHMTSYTPDGGYDMAVEPERCAIYTFCPDANLPHGNGDWRAAYKNWWQMDVIQKLLSLALERWGAPALMAQGPQKDVINLQADLDKIRQGASAALPDNVKVMLLTAPGGLWEGFLSVLRWHSQQISLNIQSNILSTGEGEHGSTSAGSDVHQDAGQTVYDFIAEDLESLVTHQIIRRLCVYNFPNFDMAMCPRLSLRRDQPNDVLQKMQTFDLGIKDGVIWKGAKFIREAMGWPPLDDEEEAGIEAEQKAQMEAQQRVSDAQTTGKVKALSDHEFGRAIEIVTAAVMARMEQEKRAA